MHSKGQRKSKSKKFFDFQKIHKKGKTQKIRSEMIEQLFGLLGKERFIFCQKKEFLEYLSFAFPKGDAFSENQRYNREFYS